MGGPTIEPARLGADALAVTLGLLAAVGYTATFMIVSGRIYRRLRTAAPRFPR